MTMIRLSFAVEAGTKEGQQRELNENGRNTQCKWCGTEWKLSQIRGGAGEKVERELNDDDVIELEMEDGNVLFLAPDQLQDYGFQPSRSGDAIEIGATLSVPDAASRDGAIAWTLRSIRLWRNPAGAVMHVIAGTLQDCSLGQRRGWYRFGEQAVAEALDGNQVPSSADPVLLMIHGTMSSTPGSFGGLLRGRPLAQLRQLYGDRIYGFEHRTLTDSPLDNALELVAGLPDNLTADLITHSRGGLVAELLIRAAELERGGIFDEDIKCFIERVHDDDEKRIDLEEDLQQLREQVLRKKLRIRRLVRTAAPMRGTTLLSGRLDRWASVFFNLLKTGFEWGGRTDAAQVVGIVKALMLMLTRQRADATVLPGLEAMRPESPWMILLNPPPDRVVKVPTFVIAGDYQGKGLLGWLADRFSDSFYGGANDFIVNTVSMSGGAHRRDGLRRALFRDRDTHHLNYFKRELVQRRILDALEKGQEAAGFETIQRETAPIARGGRKTKEKAGAPIALLLPGIIGSHLQVGQDRIWMQPHEILFGKLQKLDIDANNVSPDGWLDSYYERFSDFLSSTHEVRPFAYDWRLSIAHSGALFAETLKEALAEAEKRNRPVHIFAHSMGGLVARWALGTHGLWDRFEKRIGSRLVMLGTPNGGSHSIPWLLMGQEKTIRFVGQFDGRHNVPELVELFRRFPGILQLMPYGGTYDDDFFRVSFWQSVRAVVGTDWPIPDAAALAESKQVLEQLHHQPLAGKPVVYVAGYEAKEGTIAAIGLGKPLKVAMDPRGDGRVLWSTGIPNGVSAWFAPVAHGDLPRYAKAFEAYRDLAVHGATGSRHLSQTPPITALPRSATRDAHAAAQAAPESLLLYPTVEEVIAAAIGARLEDLGETPLASRAPQIRIVHGSIASARGAVLVGRYEDDEELNGAPKSLDCLIGGGLTKAWMLNCLPRAREEAIVIPGDPRAGELDAIVIGLGRVGELTSAALRRCIAQGLRRYILERCQGRCDQSARRPDAVADGDANTATIDVATVLVGSGAFGLAIDDVVAALAGALEDVQASLLALPQRMGTRIGTLVIYEIDRARAECAAGALDRLARLDRDSTFLFDGKVYSGEHGIQTHLSNLIRSQDALRVVIQARKTVEDGLDFIVISKSARSDTRSEPQQGQFVTKLLDLHSASTSDQVGLSRCLFELLVPNDYKPVIGTLDSLVLNVDEAAASIPWEWMRDGDASLRPLATRLRIVRQLVRPPKASAPRARMSSALVIGDTATDSTRYATLTGARREMAKVKECLNHYLDHVLPIERISSLELLEQLLVQGFGLLHIAAHGDWVELPDPDAESGRRYYSGVVLEGGLLLTSHQIAKLPQVPELVFLNCCHLGDARRESRGRWSELAASLAIAFIDRGAKAVVAAGWAVNDAAAEQFADTFYHHLFGGSDLADAALAARKVIFDNFPGYNTWSAYQVYGDPNYRPRVIRSASVRQPPARQPLTTRLAALDAVEELIASHQLAERCLTSEEPSTARKAAKSQQIQALRESLATHLHDDAEVLAALGRAYQAIGDRRKAIETWRKALSCGGSTAPLAMIEQLANAETREAAASAATSKSVALELVKSGTQRINNLLAASGKNIERLGILASAYKRSAWVHACHPASVDESGRDPLELLRESIKTYREAMQLAEDTTGAAYHYPANNWAQLAALEYRLTHATAQHELADLTEEIRSVVGSARRNAEGLAAVGGNFWDHAAAVDCALSTAIADLLSSAYDQPNSGYLIDAVAGPRSEIRRRFGDSYKNASPREQLQFFIAMLRWRAESGAANDQHAASLRQWQQAFEALLAAFDKEPPEDARPGPRPTAQQQETDLPAIPKADASAGEANEADSAPPSDPKPLHSDPGGATESGIQPSSPKARAGKRGKSKGSKKE
jgi:tetratricopeptide (TPR) repeat protein/pimeloyl-ACP methyl ester carboxylesterase